MLKKKTVVLAYFCVICFLLYNNSLVVDFAISLYSWSHVAIAKSDKANHDVLYLPDIYRSRKNENTIVLFWKPPFEYITKNPIMCDKCIMTFDQSAQDIADAIVFHFREISDSTRGLPLQNRNPQQIWIWYSMEPPGNVLHDFKKTLTSLNGIFNWTMSYRADSDVYAPYGTSYTLPRIDYLDKDILKKKTAKSLGIAIISNCGSKIRNDMIAEVSKYASIDVYGKCSGKALCRGDCQKETIASYKFYFAFENSRCKHYVSEKFWSNGLLSDAVPVVMGASREYYNLIAPEYSYIHVDDFQSIEELAQHLKMLDKNNELYMNYFKWRKMNSTQQWPPDNKIMSRDDVAQFKGLSESLKYNEISSCLLCHKLKNRNRDEIQTIEHLDTWWYGDGYSQQKKNMNVCQEQEGRPYYVPYLIVMSAFAFALFSFVSWCMCVKNRSRTKRIV